MRIQPSLSERIAAAVIQVKNRDDVLRWMDDVAFTGMVVRAVEEHWQRERPTPQKKATL